LQEDLQKDDVHRDAVLPHVDALVRFIDRTTAGTGRNLEKAEDDPAAWGPMAAELQWFTTEAAARFAKIRGEDVQAIFGLACALTRGRTLLERKQDGALGTHFVGYEAPKKPRAGTILLDATAKTHGITALCPWQKAVDVPEANYSRLEVVHVAPPHTQSNLKAYVTANAEQAERYQSWILEVISKYVDPGQKALVVCDKWLLEHRYVPSWQRQPADPRFKTPEVFAAEWGWDVDGRLLCATNWGNGVGENAWAAAEVVILFHRFYRPHRINVAVTQAVQDLPTSEGAIARMTTMRSKTEEVEAIKNGHLLRAAKQMGLRGNARNYDAKGVCGVQRLVFCDHDVRDLTTAAQTLFPGTGPVKTDDTWATRTPQRKASLEDLLVQVLGRANRPAGIVSVDWVVTELYGALTSKTWRDVTRHVTMKALEKDLASLGLIYRSTKGRNAKSYFEELPGVSSTIGMAAE
jgi:hypothetical protein